MNYEAFAAKADSTFKDCALIKEIASNMQETLSAVPGMVRKNERLEKEKAELKAEIERLKDEISGDYIRLPLDADGVPIRLGDEVWYVGTSTEIKKDGQLKVAGLVPVFDIDEIYIVTRDYPDKAIAPHLLTHKQPEQTDSWEKLEEDALNSECLYFGNNEGEHTICTNCQYSIAATGRSCRENMQIDLIERAKKLAGIEEQEGE